MEYGPAPGVNDLGAFGLDDAPDPDARPHRISEMGDRHSGQALCHDCGWSTEPGNRRYHEDADRHRDATR